MKLVLFSDLHLDASFQWASLALGRKLRLAIRETFDRISRLAVEEGADVLLCAGDLYEQENFTPDTAEYLRAMFADQAPTKVIIAPGNHDWYGPTSLYQRVQWSPNVYIFSEAHFSALALGRDLMLWGAAHRGPANTDDFLQGFHVADARWNVALFHGAEHAFLPEQEEGKAPHAAFQENEIPRAGLIHAFVGHYHRPKDTKWLTYAGSPQPLAFGEGAGGAVVIEIIDGEITRRHVDVSSIPFHTLDIDVSGASTMAQIFERAADAVSGLKGVARITLTGSLSPSVDLRPDDLEAMDNELDGLVVRVKDVIPCYDFDALSEEQTVRGQFVRDVRSSALADTEKDRVLSVGLRALDGRADLEPL